MIWKDLAVFLFFGLVLRAQAQFQFFEQMFGQGHQQQQQQQQHRASATSQWAANADIVPCSEYLCPGVMVCVSNPVDCPCPDVQDVKCLVPDLQDNGAATVLCVRGENGCDGVDRLTRTK